MESTLSLSLTDLSQEVGYFLGYGRGLATSEDPAWTATQQANINSCLKSGLRQFYYPPPLVGESASYDWSFLKPTASIPLPQSSQQVQLPDDFGGIEGQITVAPLSTASLSFWPVPLTGEGTLRQQYAMTPTWTGRPILAAVVPLKAAGQQGQRFALNVFPIADQDYTLQVPYYVNPDFLTGATPYPLGGLQHAETIREACLMAAENFLDDGSMVHQMKFSERLSASVQSDRKFKPQTLGYNRDRSDLVHTDLGRGQLHYLNYGGITVNGVQY